MSVISEDLSVNNHLSDLISPFLHHEGSNYKGLIFKFLFFITNEALSSNLISDTKGKCIHHNLRKKLTNSAQYTILIREDPNVCQK